jgi:hypothetical protein
MAIRDRLFKALRHAAVVACAASGVFAAGCAEHAQSGSVRTIDADALSPVAIDVHPLTRIGADRDGVQSLVLHLEVRDRFGHAIKALGEVRVELYKPVEGAGAGGGIAMRPSQQRVWTIDLIDPERNAAAWDAMITRTYTMSLGGLPEWLLEWRNALPTDPAGQLSPSIQVVFRTADAQGRERVLRTNSRLRR